MKYVAIFLVVLFSFRASGQVVGWHDSINCATTNTTLHAVITGDIPIGSGITADDGYSGLIPIGFTFNFYGTPYTQLLIGSNGNLCFTSTLAGAYDPWPISAALLGNPSMYNCICGPWCDILLSSGGTITYSTDGVAPNRKFAVTYCGDAMFTPGLCPGNFTTSQIILYETTNVIEVHIAQKQVCTAWNGGRGVCGVQNATGTVATVAPLRDWSPTWTAYDEGWRYSPIAGPSYSVTGIPYAPIPYASSAIYWYDSTTGAYLGTGPTLPVAPVVGTTYKAAALGCWDSSFAYIDVIAMPGLVGGVGSIPHIDSLTFTNPTICGKCDGTVTLYGVAPHQVDSVIYSLGGVVQPTIVDSAGIDSMIHLSGFCAGSYDYFYVKVGNCPSNNVGPIIMAPPPMHIGLNYTIDLGCTGDQISISNLSTPTGTGYTSNWDFGDTTTASTLINPVHTYQYQGTHNVHYTFATTYGCSLDTTFPVMHLHPLYDSFVSQYNAICVGTSVAFTNYSASGTNGDNTTNLLTYKWEYGTGATDTALSPTYEFDIPGLYKVKLTVTDTIGCKSTFTDTVEVIFIDVHTGVHDTSVCLVDSLQLQAYPNFEPKYVPFTYSWTPVNNIGMDSSSSTNFMGIGTYVYTILVSTPPMLSSANGCQASDTERVNSYPPVVIENLTPSPQVIPYGSSIQLNASGAVYYTWTPDNGTLNNNNINNPVATPVDSTTIYTVSAMNLFGCITTAQVSVTLDYGMSEFLPTAFTPNGDGLNDVFKLTRLKYQRLVEFIVYNRWGQEVFRTINPDNGWDGTFNGVPCDMGVYNYVVVVARPDGSNKSYKGSVTLIR